MKTVTDDQLNEMLNAIEDPALRQHYSQVITGTVTHELHCDSDLCKGRVIAHKYIDGQWVADVDPKVVAKSTKKNDLEYDIVSRLDSYRVRFDGKDGFRCECGNTSILSEAENGVISAAIPTKKDLQTIFAAQEKSPTQINENPDGSISYDGFTITPVKGQA